jgi:hypothetical protein
MEVQKEVLFEPFPKQQEFFDAALSGQYNFVTFGGAIRGGKTFSLLALFLLLCRFFPGSRWAIVRRDLPTIKKNLYPSWDKIKPLGFIVAHNHETHTVTMRNGSQLIFFPESYDTDKELNRWRGLEVNGFGFEEINECQRVSLYKAFERAGSYIIKGAKVQPKPLVVATCNPTFGWFKEEVYEPWKKGTLKPTWHYIQSRIYDNIPLLTQQPDYLPSLKENLNRFEYEVFVEGNWDIQLKTGGEFYKCFELELHVTTAAYDPALPLHVSWDDNVNPYLPMGIFQIHRTFDADKKPLGFKAVMIDEIAGMTPGNTVKAVCNEFIRRYQHHTAGLFVYGDATAEKEDTKLEKGYSFYRLVLDFLKDYKPQLRLNKSNPSVAMRGNWINTVLEKNIGHLEFLIGENCKKTINDFVSLKEAADGSKSKEMDTDQHGVRFQKVGHFTDLFDYFVCTAFMGQFHAYQKGSTSFNVTTGRNRSNHGY